MTLFGPEADTILGLVLMIVAVWGRYALYWLRSRGSEVAQ